MADVETKRKGRPKKRDVEVVETPSKKGAAVSNGDDGTPPVKRRRGRPSKSGTASSAKKTPVAGRRRGRPSKNNVSKKKQEVSEDDDDAEEDHKEESSDEDESS